jgi:hypothetical protein
MTQKGWPGFEMRLIDRFMRAPHAELGGAAIGALVSSATLVAYSDLPSNLHLLMRELRGRAVLFEVFAVIFAIGGWWSVRTWRRLWRRGRSARERLIYDYGVRSMGVLVAAYIIVGITWLGWKTDSGAFFGPLMSGGAIAAVFFGVPVGLNFGFFWGRTIATINGLEEDPQMEVGEPPHLT